MKYLIYIITLLITLKVIFTYVQTTNYNSLKKEKNDVIERANYLLNKLNTPYNTITNMPASIGPQFQGEWALYSCSMLSTALVNISKLYPEQKLPNIQHIDSLINIVTSFELRYYDAIRWAEDPLDNFHSNNSHLSYLSHLALMICNYKQLTDNHKHDDLLHTICETMNRRILASECLNIQTYPGEPIYIPDMLVAIVALKQYSDFYNNQYISTVDQWVNKAKNEWIDNETGLLVSILNTDGSQYENMNIKGSYAALNCHYLTYIDEIFAKEQYDKLKSLFWKNGLIRGLKEYHNKTCHFGFDIDAGPILFELTPSGTAFFAGPATFFNDNKVRKNILTTAEIAGTTIKYKKERHYLLANVALVGEAIMLAMRTHYSDIRNK